MSDFTIHRLTTSGRSRPWAPLSWTIAALTLAALVGSREVRLLAQAACTNLLLTMTDSPDPAVRGGTVTYTVDLSRSSALTNATFTDVLPPGVTFQSLTAPPNAVCTTPAVGANGTVTCTFTFDPTGMYAITSTNNLVRFASASAAPTAAQTTTPVTGLQGGESLLAIDFRPATQELYALGSTSRLYRLDRFTGVATQVGSGTFGTPLSGTSFGFDFNPVVDRIRVVSDAEQNLRLNPDTGAITGVDTPLNPTGNVVAAAYSNNLSGATQTTLYGIDSGTNQLILIGGLNGTPSPNGGLVTAVGALGVNTSAVAGFDIAPDGTARALLTVGGVSQYYTINLATGAATLLGNFPANTFTDIAVPTRNYLVTITVTVSPTFAGTLTNTASVSTLTGESCTSFASATTSVPCPTITVSPATLPSGVAANAYPDTQFTQSGGLGSATFSITAGALPPGMTLSSAGVLSGTPTAAGNFLFTVTATDVNGCTGAQTYSVTVAPKPTVALSPVKLNFGAVNDGAGTLTVQTPAQTLTLTQAGLGAVTWTATADQPWITVLPTSGSGPGVLTVSVSNPLNALPPSGVVGGTITLATVGAANSVSVPVTITVVPPGGNTGPTGSIDTPADGQSDVTGSIAVTGWAIDDIGVKVVRVCRDAIAGEVAPIQSLCNNEARVYIGDAVLVAGARPDIAALFPTRPYADRAGWGYLLLTNFLPAKGNGTFTLVAFAEDYDGFVTELGTKTITCTNATATAPFGAIDTPAQGGTASGAAYPNFGWVLAGQPTGRFIPTDGSTIQVYVDAVPIGNVDSYNNPRSDIQTLFPGYVNTDGALGLKILNTTALENGVHTIFWIAADNLGTAAGIGSRYFTVSNSAVAARAAAVSADGEGAAAGIIDARPAEMGDVSVLSDLPASQAAVGVRHGFDSTAPASVSAPDQDGRHLVRTAQLERIVLDLNPGGDHDAVYRGYTRVGQRLSGLPIGSHLDAAAGEFVWAPGLAFGGAHDLVFVKTTPTGSERIDVRVTIEPQAARAGEPRLVIDIPSEGATVGDRFTIAGWALDPSGPASGTGIDTLHVWAYPHDDGARGSGVGARGSGLGARGSGFGPRVDPIWIGVAVTGGLRPDVGDLFGARFDSSGYGIEAEGLAPGTYDIVVYAHSVASGTFTIAKSVRVVVR